MRCVFFSVGPRKLNHPSLLSPIEHTKTRFTFHQVVHSIFNKTAPSIPCRSRCTFKRIQKPTHIHRPEDVCGQKKKKNATPGETKHHRLISIDVCPQKNKSLIMGYDIYIYIAFWFTISFRCTTHNNTKTSDFSL